MSRLIVIEDAGALGAAEDALREGEPVVLPTDTVYGLAALPSATEVLFALKGRPETVPIAVLVASLEQAASVAAMSGVAEALAHAFWPGPLTIVRPRVTGTGTVAVRCPDHAFLRQLTSRVGPLAVTSANRHGEATPAEARDAAAALAGSVSLIIDGGPCNGVASTVVDATASPLTVIRSGPITEEQIRVAALR